VTHPDLLAHLTRDPRPMTHWLIVSSVPLYRPGCGCWRPVKWNGCCYYGNGWTPSTRLVCHVTEQSQRHGVSGVANW